MRKRLFTLTIVLSACIDFVLAVNSTTIKIDDIYYLFTEGSKNVLVTKPDEYKVDYTQKSIVIPSKVYTTGIWVTGSHSIWTIDMGYYNVSGIDNEAFKPIYRNNVIESIIIPESVTSIGEKAFYGCTNIFSLTIPNTVTSIGNYAFAGVTNVAYTGVATGSPWGASYINGYVKGNLLFSDEECTTLVACSNNATGDIVIPNSVTSIGNYAFDGCSSLTSVTIPNSVTSIGNYVFSGCSSLTSVTIPNSVTTIGNYAFYNCSSLTSIEIPNSVTSIGGEAFSGCSGLTSITIPNSVTSIGEGAFYKVLNVVYSGVATGSPWGASYINGYVKGNLLFSDEECTTLVACSNNATGDIVIPNSVTSIEAYAFNNCTGLTSVTIPNSVTSIGERAFSNCSGLTSVTIPNSVTSIGYYAFYGCSGLTSVTIPNSVTSIGDYAFSDCSGLTSITIPNSVTSIGSSAFEFCRGLTSVTIPNSVTSIGNYAFYDCSSLTSVTIPNSVTSIGNSAFYGCSSLTSVTIGNSVTSIGKNAFSNCSSLTAVHISDVAAWCNISFDSYETNPLSYAHNFYLNGKLVTDLVIPNSVTSIKNYAFCGCSSLTSITIPNSVTGIGAHAFENCSSLTSIEIPNSVTSIGGEAFSGCSGLTSVTIPNSVTSIGIYAFSSCSTLTAVHISDLVAWCKISFGNGYANPLCYASNLYLNGILVADLVIPNNVTSIGNSAFYGCSGLTSVTIPNSVTSIGSYAFSGCSGLKSVTMESVTPPSVYTSSFPNNVIIYVPLGALKAYQEDDNWKNYNLRVFDTSYKTSASYPTSATITFTASINDENKNNYIGACGIEEGEEFSGNTVVYIGLEPESEYANIPFYIRTTKGDVQNITVSFTTSALTLKTQQSQPVSANTAILLAETNMSDAETSCGFEWKRNDAPADMPATQVLCPVANGLMAGRLKGLKDDVYYKYRAFYQSAAGNYYYGDWQYIFTGDVTVEFDPILYTYAAQFVTERTATVKGYALAGSEDFTEQGFEYWAESRTANAPVRRAPQDAIGERKTVQGKGISMRVTLNDLDEGTVYKYRTYAKVGNKTLYGTEMSFTTQGTYEEPVVTDLEAVNDADNADGNGSVSSADAPQARKVMENNRVYIILPDGRQYDLQGKAIR